MLHDWLPTIIAIVGSLLSGYVGVRVALAGLAVRVTSLETEIGDSGRGMRKKLHDFANRLGRHDARLFRLEEKTGIDLWRDE